MPIGNFTQNRFFMIIWSLQKLNINGKQNLVHSISNNNLKVILKILTYDIFLTILKSLKFQPILNFD